MQGNPQFDNSHKELDPDLLSTPFAIQTNWQVISGAPSCGKTTLINLIAEKGFQIAQEGARLYMEREVSKGRKIEEIHANVVTLQRAIKHMQLKIERELRPTDTIFLDRGIPDTLAWYRVFGLNPNEFLQECFHHRYESVFILDQLPLHQNGFRFNDMADVSFFDEWHFRDYSSLGYSPVKVPVLSPEQRLAFILDRLAAQGILDKPGDHSVRE